MRRAPQIDRGDRRGRGSPAGAPVTSHNGGAQRTVTGDHDGTGAVTRTILVTGARGGQGTTTVAAALALYAATAGDAALVSADEVGMRVLLGVPAEDDGSTLVGGRLVLAALSPAAGAATVVLDGGRLGTSTPAGHGDHYVVLRGPCYVALATLLAADAPRPDGIILVAEEGRSLTARDVSEVTGLPVIATVQTSLRVARSIDAGLLPSRLPRLRELAELRHIVTCPPPPTTSETLRPSTISDR